MTLVISDAEAGSSVRTKLNSGLRNTLIATAVQTTGNYTATAGDHVWTDTTAGFFTVTLPPTPANGDAVVIQDVGGTWSPTNYVLIGRNGSTILGAADDNFRLDGGNMAIFRYNGTTWRISYVAQAVLPADNSITNAQLANMAANTVKGRVTGSTGDPEDLTAANVRTIINVADGANAYVHPNHTGDVTSTADGATVIANAAVTNAKLANMDAGYVKMRTTAGAGAPEDIEIADNAAVRSAATGRPLVAANIEAASAIVTLTEAAIVTDPDWDTFINGEVTLTANRVMDAFVNGQPGTWRSLDVIQNETGTYTLGYAAGFQFAGGTAPVVTAAANARSKLSIFCRTASIFEVFSALDIKAPA